VIYNIRTNSGFHSNYTHTHTHTHTHTRHSSFLANYGHIYGGIKYINTHTHASGFHGNCVNGCAFPALVASFPW
jgi:hypothetical protein